MLQGVVNMQQVSGVRGPEGANGVQASGFRGHFVHKKMAKNIVFLILFTYKKLFLYILKKIFLKKISLNSEHCTSKSNYYCISTLLEHFLFINLFTLYEQISKYPIKTTFFAFLLYEQCIKIYSMVERRS
jgi:hypothetical protein